MAYLKAKAAALNHLFLHSTLPQTCSEITATSVPTLAVPSGHKDVRPIAALVTLRMLVGYLFLHFAPSPSWYTLQCAFVSGRDASRTVLCISKGVEATVVHCTAGDVEGFRQSLPQRCFGSAGQNSCWITAKSVRSKHAQLKLCLPQFGKCPHRETARVDRGVLQSAPESPFLLTWCC